MTYDLVTTLDKLTPSTLGMGVQTVSPVESEGLSLEELKKTCPSLHSNQEIELKISLTSRPMLFPFLPLSGARLA